jgi:hypothetical protein
MPPAYYTLTGRWTVIEKIIGFEWQQQKTIFGDCKLEKEKRGTKTPVVRGKKAHSQTTPRVFFFSTTYFHDDSGESADQDGEQCRSRTWFLAIEAPEQRDHRGRQNDIECNLKRVV